MATVRFWYSFRIIVPADRFIDLKGQLLEVDSVFVEEPRSRYLVGAKTSFFRDPLARVRARGRVSARSYELFNIRLVKEVDVMGLGT